MICKTKKVKMMITTYMQFSFIVEIWIAVIITVLLNQNWMIINGTNLTIQW